MSTTPSLVLFDLDGVLVDYDRAARVAHLAAAIDVDAVDLHAVLFDSGLEDRFDAGEIEGEAYLEAIGAPFGRRIDHATWCAARGAAMRLDPHTVVRVEAVAARCDVALLTNNGGLLVDALPALLPTLAACFDGRLLASARLGARKPDSRVFVLPWRCSAMRRRRRCSSTTRPQTSRARAVRACRRRTSPARRRWGTCSPLTGSAERWRSRPARRAGARGRRRCRRRRC
ncbi:MAG TPA: hypothetical protein VIG54_04490 [Lysobacter sp.]